MSSKGGAIEDVCALDGEDVVFDRDEFDDG